MEIVNGQMRVGDEWNLLQIIANTQSNPRVSISKLIENSIDANAKNIAIVFPQSKKRLGILIMDDGEGFPLHAEKNIPDVEGMPQKVGDSIKKKYDENKRKGIHGQFGIGTLGFWSMSDAYFTVTKRKETDLYFLNLEKGKQEFQCGKANEEYLIKSFIKEAAKEPLINPEHSTTIFLYPLNDEVTKWVLTPQKIADSIAERLGERIRNINITISFHKGKKQQKIKVEPLLYSGIEIIRKSIQVSGCNPINIFINLVGKDSERKQFFSLFRDGTLIKKIRDIEGLNVEPFNRMDIVGSIDWPDITVTPNRIDITRDEKHTLFVSEILKLSSELKEKLQEGEKKLHEGAGKKVMDLVKRAFTEAMGSLSEYSWFPVQGGNETPGGQNEKLNGGSKLPQEPLPPLKKGIMGSVKISPKYIEAFFNVSKKISLKAYDTDEREISTENIEFEWTIINNFGSIAIKDKNSIVFNAKSKYELEKLDGTNDTYFETIKVKATQNHLTSNAEAQILISNEKPKANSSFPPADFEKDPLGKWRSRWDENIFQMTINSAHPDYTDASKKGVKYESYYIGKLYAKELVLINFKDMPQNLILERLIEMEQQIESQIF